MSLDLVAIRAEFPILGRQVNGNPLVYLDNAASTQKPQCVIDAIADYYGRHNSNVHRGAHALADEATRLYEGARDRVASFINARDRGEVIWTSGTTEAINIIAHGLTKLLTAEAVDPRELELVVTEMEHHANLVTWQQVAQQVGAKLRIAPLDSKGDIDNQQFVASLGRNTKLVAFPHISNALGTVNPVADLIRSVRARAPNALVLIDGAQGIAHGGVDVQQLDCDFYVFSGHKLFAPTGVGVLWGRRDLLADWPVWQTGGEMIATVSYNDATWGELPNRLEAGTPNIAGVVGLGAAVKWFTGLHLPDVHQHEASLMETATQLATAFPELTIIGNAKRKLGVLSFNINGVHPADIGFLLDKQGIAIRTGDHCAQPLMAKLEVPGTARASFSIYNTQREIEQLFAGLAKAKAMLLES